MLKGFEKNPCSPDRTFCCVIMRYYCLVISVVGGKMGYFYVCGVESGMIFFLTFSYVSLKDS